MPTINKYGWTPDRNKTSNYLHYDKKHTNEIVKRIIADYGGFLNEPSYSKKKSNYFYNKVSGLIQKDWNKFMTWYNTNSVKYPRTAKPKRRQHKYYSDMWQQKNLDGSFAYNGVTDDF